MVKDKANLMGKADMVKGGWEVKRTEIIPLAHPCILT